MPTIKDGANKAGVSVITVSRYFNDTYRLSDSTEEKIKNTIDGIAY